MCCVFTTSLVVYIIFVRIKQEILQENVSLLRNKQCKLQGWHEYGICSCIFTNLQRVCLKFLSLWIMDNFALGVCIFLQERPTRGLQISSAAWIWYVVHTNRLRFKRHAVETCSSWVATLCRKCPHVSDVSCWSLQRFKQSLCLYLPFYGFANTVFFINNYFWLNLFFPWCITMWCRDSASCLSNKDRNMHITKFYWKTESVLSHRPLYNVCSYTTSVLLIITLPCFILEEQKHRNCS
jgi:hypothetical protein